MSEETTLENLDQALKADTPSQATDDVVETTPSTPAEPQIDAQGRSYATGKRKNAIARVWIKPGAGRITVNGKGEETYFARPVQLAVEGFQARLVQFAMVSQRRLLITNLNCEVC